MRGARRAVLFALGAALGGAACNALLGLERYEDVFLPAGGAGGADNHGGGGAAPDPELVFGLALPASSALDPGCPASATAGAGFYLAALDAATGSCQARRLVAGTLSAVPSLRFEGGAAHFLVSGGLDATFDGACPGAVLDGAVIPTATSQLLVLRSELGTSAGCLRWVASVASASPNAVIDGRSVAADPSLVVVAGALGGASASVYPGKPAGPHDIDAGGGGLVAAFATDGSVSWVHRYGHDTVPAGTLDAADGVRLMGGSDTVAVVGTMDTTAPFTNCGADSQNAGSGPAASRWSYYSDGSCRELVLFGETNQEPEDGQFAYATAGSRSATRCREYLGGHAGSKSLTFYAPNGVLAPPLGGLGDAFVASYGRETDAACFSASLYRWSARFAAVSSNATSYANRAVVMPDGGVVVSAFVLAADPAAELRFARCDASGTCTDPPALLRSLDAGDALVVLRLGDDGTALWSLAISGAVTLTDSKQYGVLRAPQDNLGTGDGRVFVTFAVASAAPAPDAVLDACPELASGIAPGHYVSAWSVAGQSGRAACLWARRVAQNS